MIVRSATPADIPALISLDRESPSASHWSQEQYSTLFTTGDEQYTGRLTLVMEVFDDAPEMQAFRSATAIPEIVACLAAHRVDTEWELENIVVAEKSRRQGLGSRLLQNFIELVRNANSNFIFLEVRDSNHIARTLYERFGFESTGRRKNYYLNPPEDAILYRLVVRQFS